MLTRTFLILAIIFMLGGTQALSGTHTDHLQPEEGLFGYTMPNPYYEAVSERLLSSTEYRKCQVVFLPSFSQESSVYIEYNNGNSNGPLNVVTSYLKKQLWFEMQELMEANADKNGTYYVGVEAQRKVLPKIHSKVDRFEAPIEKNIAIALEQVWIEMLNQTHYSEKAKRGLDGETYHFANFTLGLGYRTGKAWSPDKDTLIYEFVELAKVLRNYPSLHQQDRKKAAQNLLSRAKNLLIRMEANK